MARSLLVVSGVGACGQGPVIGGHDIFSFLADVAVVAVVEWDAPSVRVGGLADRPEPCFAGPLRPRVIPDRPLEDGSVLGPVRDRRASRVGNAGAGLGPAYTWV